ncbi:hypothetical protein ACFV6E_10760 [Streptomyces sp. NPDC059785]|uniref:hypothetical protein n=1 Tax=Streptomyces sp. NPDC059785 TaxID=3346945 RepID=UPI0036518641
MSAATFFPHSAPANGTAALDDSRHHRPRLSGALRAVKVFAGAAIGVVLLGEYGEEAGVVRR